MGENASWGKLYWLVRQNFYRNMIGLPEIQINHIYNTIKMTCTSEFNLQKVTEKCFPYRKVQLMIQAISHSIEAYKK